jgi:pyridoxal phosphate enzyme (YggS family)
VSAEQQTRLSQLRDGLTAVEARIAAACDAAARPGSSVTLVVVTKTFPASDVRLLAGLGVRDVGESRDQEAAAKAAELSALPLRWHFVGRLQSNKARSVASYATAVHSVDRAGLLGPLGSGAEQAGREVEVLVQVSLDGDPARGGVPVEDGDGGHDALLELADQVAGRPALRLSGLMAVAPRGADPAAAFERLARASARLRAEHPRAGWVSAGMSGDLEAAVAAGATHLRVGSAILGSRPPLR